MSFALPGTLCALTFSVASPFPRLRPYILCRLAQPPLSSRPYPLCHLDQRERSPAVIIRSEKGILGTTRFLASLRNDSGGSIMSFALPGTLCALTFSVASPNPRCPLAQPPLPPRPTLTVISTHPRCHLDRRERSHAGITNPKKGILGNTRLLSPFPFRIFDVMTS